MTVLKSDIKCDMYEIIQWRSNTKSQTTIIQFIHLFHKPVDSICQWLSFK